MIRSGKVFLQLKVYPKSDGLGMQDKIKWNPDI